LCSLPRRLAVVAIAKRVALLKGCADVGGDSDVGYHVGNHNLSTNQTKLVFTTAGILLEELRNNGVTALSKFKCVIIDECHERSPESDLVLALARRFMKTHPKEKFRLVLMSATFNHKRYTSYFRQIPGCSTIDTITLETAESFRAWHSQVQTFYLDNMPIPEAQLAPHKQFLRDMRRDPNSDLRSDHGKSLSKAILDFVKTLVTFLDAEEPKSAPFLVFVPTYRHLEQLYGTLVGIQTRDKARKLTLSVLHSAIDIEDCMRTLASASRTNDRRHVLLASAIADSSVTVPGVTCVIDLCRSLEVKWNVADRMFEARTVWCSKSIADQRKGRTGRTCPGRVFRLVTQHFYIQTLEQWDVPQLSMSSCHNEVLAMVCADGRLGLDDPRTFFKECLDPPETYALEDAIRYLVDMGACHEIEQEDPFFRSRHYSAAPPVKKVVPSDYGAMISALPMSVTDAQVVLEGGRIGLLHESLALMAILNHRPAPITHHFGASTVNQVLLEEYYPSVDSSNKQSIALANLSAYMYWDTHWLRKYERKQRSKFLRDTTLGKIYSDAWEWSEKDDEDNIEWCKEHNLNPSSMRSIKEIIESTMNALYLGKHEPEWLRCSDPNPIWKQINATELRSTWHLERDMLSRIFGAHDRIFDDDKTYKMCEALSKLSLYRTAEAALPYAQSYLDLPSTTITTNRSSKRFTGKENMACVHFLVGNCKFGANCKNVHSFSAPRPLCRFYPNCTKGSSCVYSHGKPLVAKQSKNSCTRKTSEPLVPVLKELSVRGGVVGWFKKNHERTILLGEGNFDFSNSLVSLRIPPFLATTDVLDASRSGSYPVSKAKSMVGIDATQLHTNQNLIALVKSASTAPTRVVWNFPFITDEDENTTNHEILIRDTFQSVSAFAERIEIHWDEYFYFCLGLQGDQFSRWNVLKSAWATGWKLHEWDHYCYDDFPGYVPRRLNGEAFPVGSTRFYVFKRDKVW
jgi:HrpA-like RNA helicase